MSHVHGNEDKTFDDAEAAQAVSETVAHALTYPKGDAFPIAVTLSDEDWVAVKTFLQVALIVQSTKGLNFAPGWLAQEAHRAWHDIDDQIKSVVKTMVENEEREKSLGDLP